MWYLLYSFPVLSGGGGGELATSVVSESLEVT